MTALIDEGTIGKVGAVIRRAADLLPGAELSFAYYLYLPDATHEVRTTILAPATAVDSAWITKAAQETPENFEFGVNSLVTSCGVDYHVPMIDFVTADRLRARTLVANEMASHGWRTAVLLDSGRSFHAYFAALLDVPSWVRFMAALQLTNTRGAEDIVDSRWVSHRLLGGCACLRLTANTSRHSMPPRIVEHFGET